MTKAVRRIGPASEIKESANTVETPSSQIIKAAQRDIEVPDSFGRIIKVRAITALQRMRMFEAIGALSRNEMYLGHASLACSVVSIDGEPVRFPGSKREVEALVDRLDNEGLAAAGVALAKLNGAEIDPETGDLTFDRNGKEKAKNSAATPNS